MLHLDTYYSQLPSFVFSSSFRLLSVYFPSSLSPQVPQLQSKVRKQQAALDKGEAAVRESQGLRDKCERLTRRNAELEQTRH